MSKLNKDNLQHIAGMAVGLVNRFTGKRYSKAERATRWFSTVAANLVADREVIAFAPYNSAPIDFYAIADRLAVAAGGAGLFFVVWSGFAVLLGWRP